MDARPTREQDIAECVRLAWEGCQKPELPPEPEPPLGPLPPIPELAIDRTVRAPAEPSDGIGCTLAVVLFALLLGLVLSSIVDPALGLIFGLIIGVPGIILGATDASKHQTWEEEVQRLVREREQQVREAEARHKQLQEERDRENARRHLESEARQGEYLEARAQWEAEHDSCERAWTETLDKLLSGYQWIQANQARIIQDGSRELFSFLVKNHLVISRDPLGWRAHAIEWTLPRLPGFLQSSRFISQVHPSQVGISFVVL